MRSEKMILLSLFLVSSLATAVHKPEPVPVKQVTAVQIQESKDNTKLKLALLAAAVTIITVKFSDKLGLAIAFDKLVMFLWNK